MNRQGIDLRYPIPIACYSNSYYSVDLSCLTPRFGSCVLDTKQGDDPSDLSKAETKDDLYLIFNSKRESESFVSAIGGQVDESSCAGSGS